MSAALDTYVQRRRWTIADPGLPPLPGGHTPMPEPDSNAHARACRWIAEKFRGSIVRGRAAHKRWAAVPNEVVMEARRALAMSVRHHTADPRSDRHARHPLADRALLLELAESASEARDLITEIEAIGLRLELRR
jgi:hypothetical protein